MKRIVLACALLLGALLSHAQSSHIRFHALPETSYYGGIHSITTDSLGRRVKDYSLSKQENGYKLEAILHVPKKEYGVNLINTLSCIPGVQLESFD